MKKGGKMKMTELLPLKVYPLSLNCMGVQADPNLSSSRLP